MKTIWKFEIGLSEELQLPKGAKFLSAGVQSFGSICLWFEVDTEKEKETRKFRAIGTGHEITRKHIHDEYLGTVQAPPLVWHVYELAATRGEG